MAEVACIGGAAGVETSTMPTEKIVTSAAQEEESDDNISLDLHVSDTEETEVPDKNEDDIPMEIEDDILNKFEIQEKNLKSDGDKKESSNDAAAKAETEKPEKEEGDQTMEEETKKSDEGGEEGLLDKTMTEKMFEEEPTPVVNEEIGEKPTEEKVKEKSETELVKEKENEEEESSSKPEAEIEADKPESEGEKTEGEEKKTEEDAKADEDHDLLTVMEEKTTEADETEFENEIEEQAKSEEKAENENENGEVSGNNTDENQSDSEGQQQEKPEPEDGAETPMDIEENEVNADDSVKEDDLEVTVIENNVETQEDCEVKSDENKENVEESNGLSVLETILTAPKLSEPKSTKRVLSDDSSGDESAKKIKLAGAKPPAEKPQDISVTKLNGFKKFMLDKSLKGITREQLEMFCIQKMCECIVQKSEIGELKVKVKQQEHMLDCLRKEVLNVGKQARDLNIVHQKVIQDVGRLQENSDKPLVVPKITRSVGLQAVVRGDEAKRKVQRATVVPTKVMPMRQKTAISTPLRNSTANTPQKTSTTPTTPNTPSRAPNNSTTPNGTPKAAPKTSEVNGKGGGGGVIDLTDEDDTKKSTVAVTQNGTKVNMINAPNGHKFVVMPNGQTVMVKLATQSPSGNIVVTQAMARTGITTNGTARGTNSVVRTLTPVRTTSQVRPIAPTPIRSKPATGPRAPRPTNNTPFRNQPQKHLRHPAPLPNAAAVHVDGAKAIPPKPHLMLNKTNCGTGIVLSWKMPYKLDLYEKIASYQLYAYQETKSEPKTENWGKIGDVKALELPMAVTLTHFAVGNRYFFAVRAVDNFSRPGEFSHYETILL